MNRLRKILALALAVPLLWSVPAFDAAAQAMAVGFQHREIADPAGPPIEVGVWYPSMDAASSQPLDLFTQSVATDGRVAGRALPLVVMSHGNGGSFAGHYDTALALAQAGFVVAALTHTGDNYRDQSRATEMDNRPRQLHVLIDYMLRDWPAHGAIDPQRVGAFGFSSGGFTVLVAAGGEPDFGLFPQHCADHPRFFDCGLVASHPLSPQALSTQPLSRMHWVHDPRLKAVVIAAPALGFAFTPAGLGGVHAKVDLWRDEDDHLLPNPFYAETVRAGLPTPPTYHVVPHADHFDFLAPCTDALAKVAPAICRSEPGFDRAAFHDRFNRDVVAFFRANLQN